MLRNVHLATEGEDMYEGFNEYDPSYDLEVSLHVTPSMKESGQMFSSNQGLEEDEGFKQAVRTSHGNRPPLPVSLTR